MANQKHAPKNPTEKPNLHDYHWLSLDDMNMVRAKQIKKKRCELEETQKQFAKRFGVRRDAVSKWETGKVKQLPQRVIEFILPEVS
jgi:DNA-binding transcriptional regulator YiaG